MGLPPWAASSSQRFVLVTGANSGLGFGICQRLIDEFLSAPSRPVTAHLILITTTRSPAKTLATITRLRTHLRHFTQNSPLAQSLARSAQSQGLPAPAWQDLAARVHLLGLELDLTNLRDVYATAARLKSGTIGSPGPKGLRDIKVPRLDVVVMNAGIGGWVGINWPWAVWDVLTKQPDAVTWPEYKISGVGGTVRQQRLQIESTGVKGVQELLDGEGHQLEEKDLDRQEEAVLGDVFCANVFGHYILGHALMPLLKSSQGRDPPDDRSRLIWVSSIEAQRQVLDEDDLQGLTSPTPYENSKRVTDILALTADLPGVRRCSSSYYDVSEKEFDSANANGGDDKEGDEHKMPAMYVTHPGICATGIIDIPLVLQWAMIAAFYIGRVLFGSVWHPITAYKGAVAPVWVALADKHTLDAMEGLSISSSPSFPPSTTSSATSTTPTSQKAKWGSSTDRWGDERVRRTEVGGGGDGGAWWEKRMGRYCRRGGRSLPAQRRS